MDFQISDGVWRQEGLEAMVTMDFSRSAMCLETRGVTHSSGAEYVHNPRVDSCSPVLRFECEPCRVVLKT